MLKTAAFGLVIGIWFSGCSSGPSEPTILAENYSAVSVDGAVLPVRGFTSVTNAAGSCVIDLLSSDLTLLSGGSYDM